MELPPRQHKSSRFKCPHCLHYAQQVWGEGKYGNSQFILSTATCQACQRYPLWLDGEYIWPDEPDVAPPNPDLGEDIIADYEEAADILNRSPMGAAALLRLCIQKLCIVLILPGKDLNSDIGELVKQGLPPVVQQALDSVRVIGNEAVHPGVLDLKDQPETARALFDLVNSIAQSLISIPKQAQAIYERLPASKRDGIEQRDS